MLEVKCVTVINRKILLCFNMLILLIFHAVSGLGRIGVSFIESVIWSSVSLMTGSLQQNVIDAAINKMEKPTDSIIMCILMDNILNTLWASHDSKKRIMDK